MKSVRVEKIDALIASLKIIGILKVVFMSGI